MDAPVSTITQAGSQQQLVTSHLVKLRGTCTDGQPVTEPAPTLTAGGTHLGEIRCRAERVAAFMLKYFTTGTIGHRLDEPAHTTTTKERFALVTVTIKGEPYVIVDIGMRMLTPRELARAQGFPDSYILDPVCWYRTESGKLKFGPLPKTHQIAKIGNSVCPVMAEVLTAANCPMYAANDNYRRWAEQRRAA
jgi:DNA (cytosine-5)-methyltransferase 1